MNPITAATVQFNHAPGDPARNLATMRGFVEQASAREVDLLVFPEMCITGYWHLRTLAREEIADLAEPVPAGPSTRRLLEWSAETGMSIGGGLIEEAGGRFYNSYVVAMPDGSHACHRKLHCFISEHLDSGDTYTVFDLPQGVRAGVLTCYDNNIGENVRMNALMGAEVLLAPHQTGGCDTPSPRCMGAIDVALWENREADPGALAAAFRGPKGREWLLKWLPARAHDNGMFLIFSNGVGRDDDEVRTGNAMILDPYGDILAESTAIGDDLVMARLDPAELEMCTGKRWMMTRRPELYGPISRSTGREEDTRTVRFRRKADAGR